MSVASNTHIDYCFVALGVYFVFSDSNINLHRLYKYYRKPLLKNIFGAQCDQ